MMNMIQNTLISMIGIGVTAMVAGVAVSTYKHYYERYADLEDLLAVVLNGFSHIFDVSVCNRHQIGH